MKLRRTQPGLALSFCALASAGQLGACAASDGRFHESANKEMTPGGCIVQTDVRSRFRDRSAFRNHCVAFDSMGDLARSPAVQIQRAAR